MEWVSMTEHLNPNLTSSTMKSFGCCGVKHAAVGL